MANVQHSALTGADLHEPKGAASASAGQVYVANGAGSGVWSRLARGAITFIDTGTPYTLTYPAAYTKVAPTTVAASGGARDVTEATSGRLTYTGATTRLFKVTASVTISQSVGANRDVRVTIAKNGTAVTQWEQRSTIISGDKQNISVSAIVSLATTDYVEVFAKNDGGSGDLVFHSYTLIAEGMSI